MLIPVFGDKSVDRLLFGRFFAGRKWGNSTFLIEDRMKRIEDEYFTTKKPYKYISKYPPCCHCAADISQMVGMACPTPATEFT